MPEGLPFPPKARSEGQRPLIPCHAIGLVPHGICRGFGVYCITRRMPGMRLRVVRTAAVQIRSLCRIMNIVILGCGRVGTTFARLMYKDGHTVTVIDEQSEAFRRLGTRFKGTRIVGNGIDEDVLRRAGIENADVFVAATQGDNRNIMAAQIAQHTFGVPRVIARIYDPIRADRYRQLGIITLCPRPSPPACCGTL